MLEHSTHASTNATSTVQSADGTTISYLSLGSGPAVIVIPGALSLASDYTAFARALAENFTVYTIERRGRGLSGPQGNDYSIIPGNICESSAHVWRQRPDLTRYAAACGDLPTIRKQSLPGPRPLRHQ